MVSNSFRAALICQSYADKHAVGYTGVFNILDYSCVSFPTGMLADKGVDKPEDGYRSLSETCSKVHDECESSTKPPKEIYYLSMLTIKLV